MEFITFVKVGEFYTQNGYRRFSSTRVLHQAGWRANLELCVSYQVQCWLTVLCSETRPNAKPRTVMGYF